MPTEPTEREIAQQAAERILREHHLTQDDYGFLVSLVAHAWQAGRCFERLTDDEPHLHSVKVSE